MKRTSLSLILLGCLIFLGGTVLPSHSQAHNPINKFELPLNYSKPRSKEATHVMIHFISNAGKKAQSPYKVEDIHRIFLDYGVSAHYMIGRKGKIYKLVNENRVAYHAGEGRLPGFPTYTNNMNDYSIGIELLGIGTQTEMLSMISKGTYDSIPSSYIGFTEDQYAALNHLLDDILARHPSIKRDRIHIIGHEEYAPRRKTDPGQLFSWARVDYSKKHIVKKGETLWAIAKRYGVTIDNIASLNNLNPKHYLWVGQELRIPGMYKVLAGDTLWEIAQKYGVSTETIATWNNINTNDPLQIGERLRVPSGTITYEVKAGDSLWKIAGKYKVSIDTIAIVNNRDLSSYLRIGEKLIIPQ